VKYLVLAYMVIWVGFFLYLLKIDGQIKSLEKSIENLRKNKD